MAENLTKLPKRGILKPSTSFEQRDLEHPPPGSATKNPHFDEQNILETHHPVNKDYGFMKIEEPKTPYEYATGIEEEEDDEADSPDPPEDLAKHQVELDAQELADRIAAAEVSKRPRRQSEPSGDEEDLQLLSPEEREKRQHFEQKRKAHYNEFHAVKMARQLMDEEGDNDEADEAGGQVKMGPKVDQESDMDTTGRTSEPSAAAGEDQT